MRGLKTRLLRVVLATLICHQPVFPQCIVGPVRLTFSESRGASLPRPVQAIAFLGQFGQPPRHCIPPGARRRGSPEAPGGLRWPPKEPSVRAGASERLPSRSCSTGRLWQTRHAGPLCIQYVHLPAVGHDHVAGLLVRSASADPFDRHRHRPAAGWRALVL